MLLIGNGRYEWSVIMSRYFLNRGTRLTFTDIGLGVLGECYGKNGLEIGADIGVDIGFVPS